MSVIAAQFDTLPTPTLDAAINIAQRQVTASTWAELFEDGVANLTAHILTLAARSKEAADAGIFAAGAMTSIKTADLAVGFGATGAATAKADEAALRTTTYGLEYLRLRSMLPFQPLVFGGTF